MRIHVVTSMNAEGLEKYGKRFLESFKEHWPDDIKLSLYAEDDTYPYPRYDLYADKELVAFLEEADKRGAYRVDDYRKDAGRFAHKVFALTNPRNFEDCDWLIWLDADTETVAPVTYEWLQTILPEDASVVYLGRKDMPHSECGFMAFNMREGGAGVLGYLRRMYTCDDIWKHEEWHDSWLFDRLKDGAYGWGYNYHNLSEGIPGMHVWDDCPLGEKLKHHKGPLRQKGKKPSESEPPGYWSQRPLSCPDGIQWRGRPNRMPPGRHAACTPAPTAPCAGNSPGCCPGFPRPARSCGF